MFKKKINFFYFILMYGQVKRERESRRQLSLYTLGPTVQIFCETFLLFCLSDQNLPREIIFKTPTHILVVSSLLFQPATFTLHVDSSPYSMHPTQCTWSRFLLACHLCYLRGIYKSISNTCKKSDIVSSRINQYSTQSHGSLKTRISGIYTNWIYFRT